MLSNGPDFTPFSKGNELATAVVGSKFRTKACSILAIRIFRGGRNRVGPSTVSGALPWSKLMELSDVIVSLDCRTRLVVVGKIQPYSHLKH
mmetsp:Transcript_6384/g.12776  ORF Transcript_6384/g.12776 Transcript_6384/m.12776 type:complete len:91 (-) Transcript_6384:75-347(-)